MEKETHSNRETNIQYGYELKSSSMTMPETIHIDHNNVKRKVCSCGGKARQELEAIPCDKDEIIRGKRSMRDTWKKSPVEKSSYTHKRQHSAVR